MMMRTPSTRTLFRSRRRPRAAMTLIELILVMALLTVVLTITTPALSDFFKGRRAIEEARRLLALTRYAASEAVARSTPVEVWFDPQGGRYGLRAPSDAAENESLEREYTLKDGLELDLDSAGSVNPSGEPTGIVFQSDGTIDAESLESVTLREEGDEGREIVLERESAGEGYVIR